MPTVLDHLVVTAPTLALGSEWIRRALGATPQPGGAHPKMGTHNRLLRLGDRQYLELIAIDPDAPVPARPRWFDLDHIDPLAPMSLHAWVARTTDIASSTAAATEDLGLIEPMARGDTTWLMAVPADGTPPLDGGAPMLIEWSAGTHPAERLDDVGLRLLELEVRHPYPDRLRSLFRSIELETEVVVRPARGAMRPHLCATIATPQGTRTLESA